MTDELGLLTHEATIEALATELERTVMLADHCPSDLVIPTCPGWNAGALWAHLGGVHRWTTALLKARATEPISRKRLDIGAPTDDGWAPWMSAGADGLLEVLRSTPAQQPVWTWGTGRNARWWARRQLHETAVHNADATLAVGDAYELDALVAADGICELLDNAPARLAWPDATPSPLDATVHLHATDSDPTTNDPLLADNGEWMVTMSDGAVTYSHGHGKGDTAVRGPVTQLMLIMNRRTDPAAPGIETFGSIDALEALITATNH